MLPVIVTPNCEVEMTVILCADGADAREPESVAVTLKLNVPVAVGVPPSTPVLELSVMLVGSEPEVTAQVYVPVPPVAVSV